jgi:hypothetical protein
VSQRPTTAAKRTASIPPCRPAGVRRDRETRPRRRRRLRAGDRRPRSRSREQRAGSHGDSSAPGHRRRSRHRGPHRIRSIPARGRHRIDCSAHCTAARNGRHPDPEEHGSEESACHRGGDRRTTASHLTHDARRRRSIHQVDVVVAATGHEGHTSFRKRSRGPAFGRRQPGIPTSNSVRRTSNQSRFDLPDRLPPRDGPGDRRRTETPAVARVSAVVLGWS